VSTSKQDTDNQRRELEAVAVPIFLGVPSWRTDLSHGHPQR
jgi:DNA invertase Pin-like site-specific DNA recombinase